MYLPCVVGVGGIIIIGTTVSLRGNLQRINWTVSRNLFQYVRVYVRTYSIYVRYWEVTPPGTVFGQEVV